MSNFAIRVNNLSKCYHIYDNPRDRLKQFVIPRLCQAIPPLRKLFPLSSFHKEFWALKDVSFEIKKGETVGIIGRNGSGKSTLLQMICGTLTPTSGSIQTSGRIAALLELGSGFNPEFTGRENVYMNAAVLGLSSEEVDARFDDIAAFADIGDFIEQPVNTYSSGMYVRLAFAVQASIDPDIFIVDEALAVGDERFQRKCFARIEALKANGTAILFVSHAPEVVIQLCDRALLLDGGRRLLMGVPTAVIKSYQKLIYAPSDARDDLISHLLESNQSESNDITHPDTTAIGERKSEIDEEDSFDKNLLPQSTVKYPVQGAEIIGVEITNNFGRRANILAASKTYRFCVRGKFLEDCEAVYFGIHIKNIAGIEITGQRYPAEGKTIRLIPHGTNFDVIFTFDLKLLPGAYFVGCGVWSADGPICRHRVLDATMFKVISAAPVHSFGNCDLEEVSPELVLI